MTTTTIPDKYATEWKFAAMLEYAWGDVLLGPFLEQQIAPAKRLGAAQYLSGPQYSAAVAGWLESVLAGRAKPTHCVDVGGGLGRVLVELLRRLPSLESATLVEPSPTLFEWNNEMLRPDATVRRVPFVRGVSEVGWRECGGRLELEADLLQKIRLVQGSVDAVRGRDAGFDLVTVLNVLDQSADPLGLASEALDLVAPRGHVCLADSYQYLPPEPFASLHELFADSRWLFVAEAELPFVFRTGERHRHMFLSHHVVYQRVG